MASTEEKGKGCSGVKEPNRGENTALFGVLDNESVYSTMPGLVFPAVSAISQSIRI